MKGASSEFLQKIEEQYIEGIADNMRTYGVSATVGRVLGVIYTNRKPMTLEELSTETGMSKTRMSQVVREMIDLNIASKVYEKGVRKDLYNVEEDYYQTFISLFTSNWQKVIQKNKMIGKRLANQIHKELEQNDQLTEETEEELNLWLTETKQWMNYYQWLDELVDFFESGEIFKHVPKPE
ncbi:GbsR/MarR family transcriptional regulator [Alkalicoccobacillus gibsonii]|jgi:HTH-type transcriptional regulator, osmoprotectant uptake regulator|uniref:HTH-type transcriptional regulator n=1 Tax=Alkalicoccobacillus gibsonii TaxID=79881 RepID=A0ABU9VHB1_9BACI|nr:GbsR/MarR family transcriptional regulator [Alkalicoccobacillus gibsonii]MBM0064508.1 GbsR/MarR family transcriptional regulator [Alkalicoccobacillus gibsonii]